MEEREKAAVKILALPTLVIVICIFIFMTMLVELDFFDPSVSFQRATVHNFNLTGPNLLTTNITVTLAARVPYKHHGVFYDRLSVHAVYGDQQITLPTPLPAALYQDHKDDAVWSPFITGNFVLQDHKLAMEASKFQERKAGKLLINVIVEGRIRKHFWKLNLPYCLYANCPVYLSFGSTGEYLEQSCDVDVNDC